MPTMKITKSVVEKIPYTESGQVLFSDTELKGFGLLIGTKSKAYFAQRDIHGRTVRVTIGKHGVFTTEQARDAARQYLAKMALGENPNKLKKQERVKQAQTVTLSQAIEAYRTGRKHLSETVHQRLDRMTTLYLKDWTATPLEEITRQMVIDRHVKLGKANGPTMANTVMELLRAVFYFTIRSADSDMANPVTALSSSKAWYKKTRRKSIIKVNELQQWYEAVELIDNSTIRDFLLLLLFTGMRRSEALTLSWDNVNFKDRTLYIPYTKNAEPLELPLSSYVHDLLQARKKRTGASPWVFPGTGKTGHLAEPKNTMKKVAEKSGVPFMLHDLRRTFITIAESINVQPYAIKALVNHKTGGDVTAGYIVMTTERLREPMQFITNHILSVVDAGTVVDIRPAA